MIIYLLEKLKFIDNMHFRMVDKYKYLYIEVFNQIFGLYEVMQKTLYCIMYNEIVTITVSNTFYQLSEF